MSAAAVIPFALPITLLLPPERYNVGLVDLRKVAEILQPVKFKENPRYPRCEFTLENRDNGTRVLVGISNYWKWQYHEKLILEIEIVTLDCPRLGLGLEKPHQHLAGMSFHGIERVEFVAIKPRPLIRFQMKREPEQNIRFVTVSRGGLVCANVD